MPSVISNLFCDAPEVWQLNVQDPGSPSLEGMLYFHNYLMFYLIIIGTATCYMLIKIIINFSFEKNKISKKFVHSNFLEIVWTILPAFILILISIPSFSLLYSLDEVIDPTLTLKVIGHQWYWSYEYGDFLLLENKAFLDKTISFDSYLLNINDLTKGSFRLLEVDNRVCLPINTNIRLLISSSDVLHSWAIPSLGLKLDACPGRLSEISTFIKRTGTFYGQCSELCGVNHGFMPIVVNGVTKTQFLNWKFNKLN